MQQRQCRVEQGGRRPVVGAQHEVIRRADLRDRLVQAVVDAGVGFARVVAEEMRALGQELCRAVGGAGIDDDPVELRRVQRTDGLDVGANRVDAVESRRDDGEPPGGRLRGRCHARR
jgi:hypothetical protein